MIKYSASYTRMRGLKGKLLLKSQLEDFLKAPDTGTITSALTKTIYGEHVQDTYKISEIEHGLKQELVLYHIRILQFMRGRGAGFIKLLLSKFELLNVKSIIRAIAGKSDENGKIEPFIFSLGKYQSIPLEDALEANNMESFIALMDRTPFARPLEIGYQQYKTEGTIFPLELALDLDYHDRVWSSLDSLGPVDRIKASKLIGMQYDITNILWIFRFKNYYKFPPEKIIQYTIPYGWAIGKDILERIISENDILGAITGFKILPYSKVLSSVPSVDKNLIMRIEIILMRYLYRECVLTFMNFPLQIEPILAFLIIGEMQIKDIITIISGRNLGLAPERIRPYLITL